jgi:hypothetical protein
LKNNNLLHGKSEIASHKDARDDNVQGAPAQYMIFAENRRFFVLFLENALISICQRSSASFVNTGL